MSMCVFMFCKHKTSYELRISDWSSDVCSPDLLRLVAQLHDADLADHVAGRLAGIVDVALDLLDDVALAHQRVFLEIVDRLLAAPALGVEAGVDHPPHRPQELRGEHAELRHGIAVEAHLLADPLGIKDTAPAIRAVAADEPEFGQAGRTR